MGADIHCYIEYSEKEGDVPTNHWTCFGGRINPGRNYTLFGFLAGVRGGKPLYYPRGLPSAHSWEVRCDNSLFVDDNPESNEVISSKIAQEWVNRGLCKYLDETKKNYITNPDYHSHSYLSLKEYLRVLNAYEKDYDDGKYSAPPEYYAIKAAMVELEKIGYASRLVFWFDS